MNIAQLHCIEIWNTVSTVRCRYPMYVHNNNKLPTYVATDTNASYKIILTLAENIQKHHNHTKVKIKSDGFYHHLYLITIIPNPLTCYYSLDCS